MTKITYIPGEIANAAIDEHGNRKPVTRTQHIFDDAKGKSQAEVNADVDDAIALHQSEINALNSQNYVTVDSFNALPATGEADTVYRVSNWDGTQQDPTVYSEYAWNGSQYIHLSTKTRIGEVFDISAYHATGGTLATYADLNAALGTNGANVPQSLRKGGVSVKFVQSSDNKYVQYRLMADEWSTTVANWQGVDAVPISGSENMVKSNGILKSIGDNCGLLHLYTPLTNPTEYHSDVTLFSVCKIEKDCYIDSIIAEYQQGLTDNVRFFVLTSNDGTKIQYKVPLNDGKGVGVPVRTKIGCYAEAGMYVFLSCFYFETLPNETVGECWSAAVSGTNLTISTGSARFKMAATLSTSESLVKASKNCKDIKNLQTSSAYNNFNEDNSTFSSYNSTDSYSICKFRKGQYIKSITLFAGNNVVPRLIFLREDATLLTSFLAAGAGAGASTPVELFVDYQVPEDCELYINAFFYKQDTENGDFVKIRDVNGNITLGRGKVSYNLKVNLIAEDIVGYENLLYSHRETDDWTLYTGTDGYTISKISKGTILKSISMCAKANTTPTLELAENVNGVFYRRHQFVLNVAQGADIFVKTDINYLCEKDFVIVLRDGFYFKALETTVNVPYVLSASVGSDGSYTSQSEGRIDIKYQLEIIQASNGIAQKLAFKKDIPYCDLSMVETMGVCGDSYAAGMIAVEPPYYPTRESFARPNLSWGKVLERHYGIDVSLYAKGGITVLSYLTDADCLPLLLSDTAKKLYAISLGHNDMYATRDYTDVQIDEYIGTIESLVGEYTDYPNTFIGNYAKIIEQIQEHAPNAYIVLLRQTRPYASYKWGANINNAISALGEHYGLPVFNPEEDEYLSSAIWQDTMIRNHPVFTGYAGLGMAFARMFEKATVKYWHYFNLFGIN